VTKSLLALGGLVSAITLTLLGSLSATELSTPPPHLNYAGGAPVDCCGCLRVAYVYHPELRSTYGLNFDPRNYDTTQPHFYLGRMRASSQYYYVSCY
jgi:hypothetical protein